MKSSILDMFALDPCGLREITDALVALQPDETLSWSYTHEDVTCAWEIRKRTGTSTPYYSVWMKYPIPSVRWKCLSIGQILTEMSKLLYETETRQITDLPIQLERNLKHLLSEPRTPIYIEKVLQRIERLNRYRGELTAIPNVAGVKFGFGRIPMKDDYEFVVSGSGVCRLHAKTLLEVAGLIVQNRGSILCSVPELKTLLYPLIRHTSTLSLSTLLRLTNTKLKCNSRSVYIAELIRHAPPNHTRDFTTRSHDGPRIVRVCNKAGMRGFSIHVPEIDAPLFQLTGSSYSVMADRLHERTDELKAALGVKP